jgi:fatty-acid desaturase
MHRMHHAYTNTEMDPHSPKYDTSVLKMMWRTRRVSNGIFRKTQEVELGFLKNLPDWPMLDKIEHSLGSCLGWIIFYVLCYVPNNHHKSPSATNFGVRWHEMDPAYLIIRLFNGEKIIRIQKQIPHATALPVIG